MKKKEKRKKGEKRLKNILVIGTSVGIALTLIAVGGIAFAVFVSSENKSGDNAQDKVDNKGVVVGNESGGEVLVPEADGESEELEPETGESVEPESPSEVKPPPPAKVTPPPAPKPPAPPPPPSSNSCPQTTLNCVPCNAGELYCRTLAGAPTGYKGWACQNNNPGNIRYSSFRSNLITANGGIAPCGDRGGYMAFSTYTQGRNGLKAYIKAINTGQHSGYEDKDQGIKCGNCTLKFFFSKYAPAGDQNDPNSYSANVGKSIGVDPATTTLSWVVQNKFEAFIDAIQKQEGFFTQ